MPESMPPCGLHTQMRLLRPCTNLSHDQSRAIGGGESSSFFVAKFQWGKKIDKKRIFLFLNKKWRQTDIVSSVCYERRRRKKHIMKFLCTYE